MLFDENLSFRLVAQLADLFPDSTHVRDVGLASASDDDVWSYATAHGFTIVSKDADFHQRSFLEASPPKVIWLSRRTTGIFWDLSQPGMASPSNPILNSPSSSILNTWVEWLGQLAETRRLLHE